MTFFNKNDTIIVPYDTLLRKTIVKHKNFLRDNFFLFKNVENNAIDTMLGFDGIALEEYLPNEIMLNSVLSEKIGILYKGNAIIRSGDDDVILRKLSVGDAYGAASLFDKHTYGTTVSATSTCTVITFDKQFVEKCIAYNNTVAINYITFLAKRISFLNTKIDAFTAKNTENKLYTYLAGLPRNDSNEVEIKVSYSTLSKMLAIGRASLYRSFEKLEKSGIIIKNGKKILLNEV